MLESRRISRLGVVDSVRRESVAAARRDAGPRDPEPTRSTSPGAACCPGDTVRYWAVATDNAPGRQSGRSREYVLRLPTMSEVRAAQRQATEAVSSRLDSVAAASKQLERQTDDLAQERPRSTDGRGEKNGESLSFEDVEEGGERSPSRSRI